MVTPEWISKVENSCMQDPHCKKINGIGPNHIVHQNALHDGVIRHKGGIYMGNDTNLRSKLFTALHSSALGGHSGMKTSHQRIKIFFTSMGLRKTWISLLLNVLHSRRIKRRKLSLS